MWRFKKSIYPFLALCLAIVAMLAAGCSTQKNTAQSRWWHAFNTRYNTFYNGKLAYIDASLEKENGNKDNFTELLPFYTVGNKNSKELGKANYDRAIEKSEKAIHQHSIKRRPVWDKKRRKTAKDKEWLNRREYNPFIWKAWMLMGRSQFFEGNFDAAAATFSYMSRLFATQPAIYCKAQAWLAKCYTQQDRNYDAEDVIRNMERDSIHWSAQKEWDYTYALYYINTSQYTQAIPYLRKAIGHEMRRKQKARLWYLMGQIQALLGKKQEAYRSFKHVVSLNPPYELELNARISQTEVMGRQAAKKMIGKLKRMAASDKNQQYLEQVYYALGNIYLTNLDTLQAVNAYEKGAKKSTRNGIEKGVLLLQLGNLYWQLEKFSDAQRCYGEAIGLLDKDRKDYAQLSARSKVLDELVPYTETIQLQDSLQSLAKMSEEERNTLIDKVIKELKKKEKEEKKKQEEAKNNQGSTSPGLNQSHTHSNAQGNKLDNAPNGSIWYFYSPIAVAQGKEQFKKLWGERENTDNWQRINKTVMTDLTESEDSISSDQPEPNDTTVKKEGENPAYQRSYYLAQIPLTPEQTEESNKLIRDALMHAAVIVKDKMGNLTLSEKLLHRLTDQYPEYEHMDDAYYHLFLLYQTKCQPETADKYLALLKEQYSESAWTKLLTSPYYEEDAKRGTFLEDSLYTATYEAFKKGEYNRVTTNANLSQARFPEGANRDKFLFVGGMSKLGEGNIQGCLEDLKTMAEKYPDSKLSTLAGTIVNGVKAGKRPYGGKLYADNIWTRRDSISNVKDSTAQKSISEERNQPFVFMLAYEPDSVDENQLLFEIAKYNFTSYLVRNFDIQTDEQGSLHRMMVKGFLNFDEARQYANDVYRQKSITRLLTHARTLLVSEENVSLLGTQMSYEEYASFYAKHFMQMKTSTQQLLNDPVEIVTEEATEENQNGRKSTDEEATDEGQTDEDEYYELEGF